MHTSISGWVRLGIVLVAIAGTQTGCNKGWKMPGSDMFPWSRKPSESTLTGTSPSLSMPSSMPTSSNPVSPATRNSPNQIAGNAAYNGRPSPYGPSAGGATNSSFANTSSNGAGTAATANGYSTGPYQTNGMNARPATLTASNGYGAPGATSGYGGPTGYTAPGGSQTPSYGPASYANAGATNVSAPGMPPASTMPAGLPPTSIGNMGMPPQSSMAQGGLPPTGINNVASPSYAPMGNHGAPSNTVAGMPAGYPGAGMPPQSSGSMPNALPGAYPAGGNSIPMPTQQAYNGPTAYRPGSVGRSTAYDFSNQGPGAVANMPPAPSAPAAGQYPQSSYPRTATEPSSFR